MKITQPTTSEHSTDSDVCQEHLNLSHTLQNNPNPTTSSTASINYRNIKQLTTTTDPTYDQSPNINALISWQTTVNSDVSHEHQATHQISQHIIYPTNLSIPDTNDRVIEQQTNTIDLIHDQTLHSNDTITKQTTPTSTQHVLHQQILPQLNTQLPSPNDSWGASISTPPTKASRIFFQDINGLQLQKQLNWLASPS
jgi:hypothetical protein